LRLANEAKIDELSSTLASIGVRFLQRLKGQVSEIETHTNNITELRKSNISLIGIGKIAHQISGIAKPVGYPELGERAAKLDSNIHIFLNGNPDACPIEDLVLESENFVRCCLEIMDLAEANIG